MMGKAALWPSSDSLDDRHLIGGLYGALIGGLGTIGYDLRKGTKKDRVLRAIAGSGLGMATGAGVGEVIRRMSSDPMPNKIASLRSLLFKMAEGPVPPVPAPAQRKAPEQVYKPKLPNSGSSSILYTPGMEQFPAPADYGPPRERHSAPTAPPGEPRNQLTYAPTPKPWQPPKPGPYDPVNAIEQQAQASRSKQLEDNINFSDPLGYRVPDPVGFKGHVQQFLGTGDPKGKINLHLGLESKGWPIPPSQARPELPFGDSYQYKHLARPPFTMPTTPTSDLQ
jgi:hypothetical protein